MYEQMSLLTIRTFEEIFANIKQNWNEGGKEAKEN